MVAAPKEVAPRAAKSGSCRQRSLELALRDPRPGGRTRLRTASHVNLQTAVAAAAATASSLGALSAAQRLVDGHGSDGHTAVSAWRGRVRLAHRWGALSLLLGLSGWQDRHLQKDARLGQDRPERDAGIVGGSRRPRRGRSEAGDGRGRAPRQNQRED